MTRTPESLEGGDPGGPARWLVDGMNVIGSRPDGWWRDREGAKRALVARLVVFAGSSGQDVGVVFDGHAIGLAPEDAVEVRFAPGPGPNAADDVIAAMAAADADPSTLRVVTSDRALAARVRATGAQVTSARGFRRRLEGPGPPDPA